MLFQFGRCVQTSGVAHESNNSPEFALNVRKCLNRHLSGDWGDLCDDDKKLNDEAVKNEDRILSAYNLNTSEGDNKIYIITEWDRSVTTVLFPSEY